jgi:LPS export ABC transporter protein LptC
VNVRPFALLALVAGLACNKVDGPPVGVRPNALADSADQVMYGSRFTINDRGVRRADIEGDTAYFFHENTLMILRPMHAKFFSSEGRLDGIVTAHEGYYDTRQAKLEARGEVVVNTIDGKRLMTPFLRYDQRIDQISSDSAFTLTEPSREMKGIGFTSDAALTTFRVNRVISAKAGAVAVPK